MSENVKEVQDNDFENEVLQASEPVLVDFWAEWCAPCRAIAPTVAKVADKYAGRARVMKLNVDNNPNVSQRFGIRGIPTLIVFKGGKEAGRVVGAVGESAIANLLEQALVKAA